MKTVQMQDFSFTDITKTYGSKKVLAGVSARFPCGSFIGVLGGNGAGKTTLFNILGNADRDFWGRVSLRGNDVAYMRTESLFPAYMKMAEVLAFYRRFYPFDEGKAKQLLREADISEKSRLSSLSAGKRRMAEFIANFCTRSPVLLLDEPLTNLDIYARDFVVNSLIDCSLDARVVAVATHEISEFENMFTHVTVLRDGSMCPLTVAESIRASGRSIDEFYREKLQ